MRDPAKRTPEPLSSPKRSGEQNKNARIDKKKK
jgi:hypothetical protein